MGESFYHKLLKCWNAVEHRLFVMVLFTFTITSLFAQKNLHKANQLFDMNMFEEAIPLYEKETRLGTTESRELAYDRLANCYRLLGHFEEAEEMYKKIFKRGRRDPENVLNYALALKASAKYAEASEEFKRYVELKPDDPMGEIYVESCFLAQHWLDESIGKEVKNLRVVNSSKPDFAPSFYKNGIVFCSSREGSIRKMVSFNGKYDEVYLDLYYLDFTNSVKPISPLSKLNTFLHEGPATFSSDGTEVFFTRTIEGKKDKKTNIVLNALQVFHSKMDSSGAWADPQSAFHFNSTSYSTGHPSLTNDGKTIFYMSDRPGGYGGTDIYFSTKNSDGSWGEPQNAGTEVNTFGYELFPFIHRDGTLYFSSNTHPGMGKLDVFSSKNNGGKWSEIQNMRPPVNSIGDDFAYVVDSDNQKGFFSSNRFNGEGSDDLYSFIEQHYLELSVESEKLRVRDQSIYDGIVYKIQEDETKEEVSLESKGGYLGFSPVQGKIYRITGRKEGFAYNKVNVLAAKPHEQEVFRVNVNPRTKPILVHGVITDLVQPEDSTAKPYKTPLKNAAVTLFNDKIPEETVMSDDKGQYKFTKELESGSNYMISATRPRKVVKSTMVHCKGLIMADDFPLKGAIVMMMKENEIIDQVVTDAGGQYQFEVKPGDDVSVVVSAEGYKGNFVYVTTEENEPGDVVVNNISMVEKEMAWLKGYVEHEDGFLDGATVTVELNGHIVAKSTTDKNGIFDLKVPPDENYLVTINKKGYFQKEMTVLTNGVSKDKPIPLYAEMEAISVKKTVKVKHVYYDYSKADVKEESIPELNRLVEFLRINSSVKIELSSHTDSRGNNESNLQLSQKRADNVTMYLVLEGIDPNRILAKGYGESLLVNRCSDGVQCSEQEHQQNRRTEFKILSY